MSHLSPMILGRNLDAESTAKILNVAQLTLANAAVGATEPVRKQEYDSGISGLNTRLTAVESSPAHLDAVYVDTTSADLATAVAAATYQGAGVWLFGGKAMSAGDILILNAATQQDEARSWVINNGTTGTVADFTALSSDIDGAIAAAVAALKGDAAAGYDTLGELEDFIIDHETRVATAEGEIDTLQSQIVLRSETRVFNGTFVNNGDGTYTATVNHSFGTAAVQVQAQVDAGAGAWDYLSNAEVDINVDSTKFVIDTSSATVGSHALRLVVTGVQVV